MALVQSGAMAAVSAPAGYDLRPRTVALRSGR